VKGKLVRDRIPGIIRSKGGVPRIRVADAREYRELLRAKLGEEADEAIAATSRAELLGELADVQEVVSALAQDAGISPEELEAAKAAKEAVRGGFGRQLVWMGNEGEPEPAAPAQGLTEMLREAHARFEASAPAQPTADVDPAHMADRDQWLRDEVAELAEAVESGDLAHIAKEGADVMYVAAGTLTEHGIDVDAALTAVHQSNLTKDAAAGGKAVKGPGYREPDMAAVVWPAGRPADFEAG
jgi:predicted house-cleaning noncanonical NTP pyrophosphatase (MazG superfamily)